MDNYATFVGEALDKTKCRECVPSWEEIQMLMSRQEMLCTVYYPGSGSCQLYINSHTTANEVWPHFTISAFSYIHIPVQGPCPFQMSFLELDLPLLLLGL